MPLFVPRLITSYQLLLINKPETSQLVTSVKLVGGLDLSYPTFIVIGASMQIQIQDSLVTSATAQQITPLLLPRPPTFSDGLSSKERNFLLFLCWDVC